MKKVLFTLGAVALVSFGLTSCGDKDCECVAFYGENPTEKIEVKDVDDCDDLTAKDLPVEKYQDADDVECSEK